MLSEKVKMEDIIEVDWDEPIMYSEKKEYNYYHSLFYNASNEAEENNNIVKSEILKLLGMVCSFHLDLESYDAPFKPTIILRESRSPSIDDLTDFDYEALELIVGIIKDPELKARLADVLWVGKRNHRKANTAVFSYIESFWILIDPEHWTSCASKIERALQIAVMLGRKNKPFDASVKGIEEALNKLNGEDPLFLSAKLMELLIEYRVGDPEKYSILSENIAIKAEESVDLRRARCYWEICSKWHHLRKDPESQQATIKCYAETYVKEAEVILTGEKPSYMLASSHILSAIEALRRIGGTSSRIEE